MAAAVRPGSRSSKSFKVVSRRTLNVHGPDSVEREKKKKKENTVVVVVELECVESCRNRIDYYV